MKTKEESVLKKVKAKIGVKSTKGFDPKEFFKTGDGLYVYSDFKERILEKAETIKSAKTLNLSSFDLIASASDEKIENSLPKKHIFSETDVCAVIAGLIKKQSKGEEGVLRNNGYANLFYTPSFVVGVGWSDSRWGVDTWFRDGGGWAGGMRVFSPATVTSKS